MWLKTAKGLDNMKLEKREKLAFFIALICSSFHCHSSSPMKKRFWSSMLEHFYPSSKRVIEPIRVDRRYNSYDKFNPDQYEKGSVEWNNAMINYLLDMKSHGENVDSGRLNVSQIRISNSNIFP